jgi:hypothetical protein
MLLQLPRELRDEIYTLVINNANTQERTILRMRDDGTPNNPPLPASLTCKQLYREIHPLFIRSLKLLITDAASLALIHHRLNEPSSLHTQQNITAIAFTTLELFRTFHPAASSWQWNKSLGMRETTPVPRYQLSDQSYNPAWRPIHAPGGLYFTGTHHHKPTRLFHFPSP